MFSNNEKCWWQKYPKEAIDLHTELERRSRKKPLHLAFTRSTNADIWLATEYARRTYDEAESIPYRKALEWRQVNNQMSMSIKEDGQFVGYSTLMPLEEQTIMSLLRNNVTPRQISAKNIRQWGNARLSIYIANVSIIPSGDREKDIQRGRFLLDHTIRWAITLCQQYDIQKFYGVGTDQRSQRIFDRLGFKELVDLTDEHRKGYVFDDLRTPNGLIRMFLSEMENE